VGIVPYSYCGASLGARNGIAYAGDRSDHLRHFVCLDYGPEMSVASARKQIGDIGRRPLGWRSEDEYIAYISQQNPRASDEYRRNQAKHGLRLNYAGKYVLKHDPEIFWLNGGFGAREVPYLWDQWAKITCPILELKGAGSDFLSPQILDRMKRLQPDMELKEVPESGHSIPADNPAFLVRELRRFLAA
jgi:pimeloyl-ACP methyl ester carboxylesterase